VAMGLCGQGIWWVRFEIVALTTKGVQTPRHGEFGENSYQLVGKVQW